MITKESIEELKNSLDIVAIISHYIELKRAGINYSACCPFHGEKTPSFMVSPSRGTYHCFGCGASGDAFSFVMEYEKLNFAESVEKVASLCNFTLTYSKERREDNKKEGDILESFTSFYSSALSSSTSHLSYLKQRGIKEESIKSFRLGYCGAGFESIKFADSLNARKEAIELGVLGENESRVYARFSDRIIFPIHSPSGKVVGFGGRITQSDSNLAKYLNSPQSRLFHKSKLLYAYHLAREEIFRKKEIIITEGYMDVIMLHQAGIKNAVATLGTALTPDHLPLLARGEPKVIVGYDGDKAGINSATKASKLLASEGKEGGVVIFPDGADPADMVAQGRIEELKALFASPIPFIRFALEQIAYSYDLNDVLQKEKALKEGKGFLKGFSYVIQEHYKPILASLIGIPVEAIYLGVKKNIQRNPQPIIYFSDPTEAIILKSMAIDSFNRDFAFEYLDEDNFTSEQSKSFFSLFREEKIKMELLDPLIKNTKVIALKGIDFKEQVIIKAIRGLEEQIKTLTQNNESFEKRIEKINKIKELKEKVKQEKTHLYQTHSIR